MAHSPQKNQIFAERLKNSAVAFQNLLEEGARLRAQFFAEIKVGGVENEHYDDTEIATKAEMESMLSFFEDFRKLVENEAVSQGWRNGWLIPFLVDESQL